MITAAQLKADDDARHRAECITIMRMSDSDRYRHLTGVERKRGAEAVKRIRKTISDIEFEARRR